MIYISAPFYHSIEDATPEITVLESSGNYVVWLVKKHYNPAIIYCILDRKRLEDLGDHHLMWDNR